jgi:hypothetical protein
VPAATARRAGAEKELHIVKFGEEKKLKLIPFFENSFHIAKTDF